MKLDLITLKDMLAFTVGGDGKVAVQQLIDDVVCNDVKTKVTVVFQDRDKGRNGYVDIDIKDLAGYIDLPYVVASNYDDSNCLTFGLFEYDDDSYSHYHTQGDGCAFPNFGPKVFLHLLDYPAHLNRGLNRDPFAE